MKGNWNTLNVLESWKFCETIEIRMWKPSCKRYLKSWYILFSHIGISKWRFLLSLMFFYWANSVATCDIIFFHMRYESFSREHLRLICFLRKNFCTCFLCFFFPFRTRSNTRVSSNFKYQYCIIADSLKLRVKWYSGAYSSLDLIWHWKFQRIRF